MKKGLSLLLAASMAVSTFATAASAAELTAQEKFDALKAEGIFTGFEDGSAGLDQSMTRAQVAAIITRLLGLAEQASNAAVYNDLTGAEWAAGYIGAVTPKYMEGLGGGKFDPSGDFTLEQLATVMVRVLDLEVEEGAAVEGNVSDWAQAYVAAAVKAGIISEAADYTKPALREALVEAAYEANDQVNVPEVLTLKATVLGKKKVQVDFNKAVDSSVTEIEVTRNGAEVSVEKITFADGAKSATIEFSGNLAIGEYSVSATGTEETASFEIQEEQVTSIEFVSEFAILDRELEDRDRPEADRLARPEGTEAFVYVKFLNQYGEDVTDDYIDDSETEFRFTDVDRRDGISFEDDGVVRIVYDEAPDRKWRTGDEISASVYFDNEDGPSVSAKAELTIADASEVEDIKITRLVNRNDIDDESMDIDDIYSDWYLLVEATDQYGLKIPENETGVYILNQDVRARVDNDDIVDFPRDLAFEVLDIDGEKYLGVPFAETLASNREAGETTVQLSSRRSNATAEFTVVVTDVLRVDTFTMSRPASAPAGSKFKIPFTAIDQFGNEITDRDVLTVYDRDTNTDGGLEDIDTDGLPYEFKRNAATGKLEFILDARNPRYEKGDRFDIEVETFTGKRSTLSIKLDEGKTVEGIKSVAGGFSTVYLDTYGFSDLELKDMVFVDQFGAEMTWQDVRWVNGAAAEGDYRVQVTSSNSDVLDFDAEFLTGADPRIDAVAGQKGSASVKVQLQVYEDGAWKNVRNADRTTSVRVVEIDDLKNFTASVARPLYEDAAASATHDYGEEVVVTGELSNGTKVVIPGSSGLITVTTQDGVQTGVGDVAIPANGNKSKFDDRQMIWVNTYDWDDATNKNEKTTVTVIVAAKNDNVVIPLEVTVSKETPKVATLVLNADASNAGEFNVRNGVLKVGQDSLNNAADLRSIIDRALRATDQYGRILPLAEVQAAGFYTVIPNNFSSKDRNSLDTVVSGDSFTVTVVANNGSKSVTFNVEVERDADIR